MTHNIPQKFKLEFNPFEPSATGAPTSGRLSIPATLRQEAISFLDGHNTGRGVKVLVIVGEYGTGKSCLLYWLHNKILPEQRIKSFYFDNPGIQFYDLANSLLRTIGRKDFAKFIWELAASQVDITGASPQANLFEKGFEKYLTDLFSWGRRVDMVTPLQEAIKNTNITGDDQIANCLARIVTDIIKKPYFEYRDFLPKQRGSVVAEKEEAPYFQAILKTILKGTGDKAIAFLIDEFEEIGLQKRLTKRAAHDYLTTMKRLINLAQSEQVDFWIVLSMTPDAYQTTKELEPSFVDRISNQVLNIEPLTSDDAFALIKSRIDIARINIEDDKELTSDIFPFPNDIIFNPTTYSNPRRLVKVCFQAISNAILFPEEIQVPFTKDYLNGIEHLMYPGLTTYTTDN